MKKIWYEIKGAPTRLYALYNDDTSEIIKEWNSGLLGYVLRAKDGSWDCFALFYCGNEPTKIHAMIRVESQISS